MKAPMAVVILGASILRLMGCSTSSSSPPADAPAEDGAVDAGAVDDGPLDDGPLDDGADAGDASACPSRQPRDRDPCPLPGLRCNYCGSGQEPGVPPGGERDVICVDNGYGWQALGASCPPDSGAD
jgi:hypothetical protein